MPTGAMPQARNARSPGVSAAVIAAIIVPVRRRWPTIARRALRLIDRLPQKWAPALLLAFGLALGCAGSEKPGTGQTPSDSRSAQREYRNLRARWFAAKP